MVVMAAEFQKEEERKTKLLTCWMRMLVVLYCLTGMQWVGDDGCNRDTGVIFSECMMETVMVVELHAREERFFWNQFQYWRMKRMKRW